MVPSLRRAPLPRTRKVRPLGVPAGSLRVTGDPVSVGHLDLGPECRLVEGDRDVEGEVVAGAAEDAVRPHLDVDEQVAGRPAVLAGAALALEPDPLAVLHPGRDPGLDRCAPTCRGPEPWQVGHGSS